MQRTAIVTGAAGTIGSAISERLVRDGHRVVLADIRPAAALDVAARLDPTGASTHVVAVDVASEPSVRAVVAAAEAWAGSLDILVNNAGIAEPDSSTWEMPLADWDRTIAVDLTGVFYACRAALPGMIERRWGRIVNISSIAGKEGKYNPVAYASAKAGVIGLTKSVAFEVAPYGVLVNAVAPGYILTEMTEQLPERAREAFLSAIPLGRGGTAEDIAGAVGFLVSEEAGYITGQVLQVDGGLLM